MKQSELKQLIREEIQKVLKESISSNTQNIYHIRMGEDWDKGYDHKEDLFFKDYNKAIEYLTSNGYEKIDIPSPNNQENWSKGYGYQATLTSHKLII